ncbi:unnamed protein product [Danaus chrysippus]|uniref:(African queen) hypothetical protein n=1 Tax=Danaus chrysippus TaxID=151541 RepID=A0A8J2QUL7_9NEOP|nr:unnamed protein product [Danaus chrysippus]
MNVLIKAPSFRIQYIIDWRKRVEPDAFSKCAAGALCDFTRFTHARAHQRGPSVWSIELQHLHEHLCRIVWCGSESVCNDRGQLVSVTSRHGPCGRYAVSVRPSPCCSLASMTIM